MIRLLEATGNDQSEFDYALYKLEQIIHIGVRSQKQGLWERASILGDLLYNLIGAYNKLLDVESANYHVKNTPAVLNTGSAGRSSFDIPKETLKLYLNYGLSLIRISEILGVSRKTIRRRIQLFGLSEEIPRYSDISNKDLDMIVMFIKIFLTVEYDE